MIVASNHAAQLGKVISDGHCVRFVQYVSDVGHTSLWRKGEPVRGAALPEGTIIATFDERGRYANEPGESHAAVLLREESDGLRVMDQWRGQPVHERLIRFRGGAGSAVNDGDAYFAVTMEE